MKDIRLSEALYPFLYRLSSLRWYALECKAIDLPWHKHPAYLIAYENITQYFRLFNSSPQSPIMYPISTSLCFNQYDWDYTSKYMSCEDFLFMDDISPSHSSIEFGSWSIYFLFCELILFQTELATKMPITKKKLTWWTLSLPSQGSLAMIVSWTPRSPITWSILSWKSSHH